MTDPAVNWGEGAAGSGTVDQGQPTSGQQGALVQAAVHTANPSYTNGQTNPLSQTPAGHLRAQIQGGAAHAAALAGNPVRIGARTVNAAFGPLANAQTTDLITTLNGVLITRFFAPPDLDWYYAPVSGGIVNTTPVSLRGPSGAGWRQYLSSFQVRNAHATVATEFMIRSSPSGTVMWRQSLPAAMAQILDITCLSPLRSDDNNGIEVVCVTTGAAVFFSAQGFTAG